VTTLQKFAVISSMQNTPVIGAGVDVVARPWVDDGAWPFGAAGCAAAGDAAKPSAAINASLFMISIDYLANGNRRAPHFVPRCVYPFAF